ncbi:hypothetical protein [Mariniphaga sp.]|uniref:hypothetical protein n=1 Tax=Mariniphaga sp. TaxID=1954475 RepID=UPI0035664800
MNGIQSQSKTNQEENVDSGRSLNQSALKELHTRIPQISLPKGVGAIKGIGEKLAANSVSLTGSLNSLNSVSPGCSCFNRQISISVNST